MLLERFEPKIGSLEKEYRQHYLKTDSDQVFIFVLLASGNNIAFSIVESLLYFPAPEAYLLLALRIAFQFFTFYFLIFLKRNKRIKSFDNFSLIWMLSISLMTFIVRILHHADPQATYITNMIELSVIFFFYLIIPTTLHYRIISTFFVTIFVLIHLFLLDSYTIMPHKMTILTMFILVNTVAFISSTRAYTYRREQYKARVQANKLTEELTTLASTDPLTGVCNRREFMKRAEADFQRFLRYQDAFSLAVFDLDQFKGINDQFGHQVGDSVLKKICEVISIARRESDVFGRIGGDEFALLLPSTSLPSAVNVVGRTQKLIQDEIIQIGDHQIQLAVSIGIATISPEENDLEALFKKVDGLLYEAKNKGGNQVVFEREK
ncbi:MAG: GGDEF domain-containing protein [Chloroflexi bacterium]|nr:GGDEF domain-containing protein [Chloroflexota bacterium]